MARRNAVASRRVKTRTALICTRKDTEMKSLPPLSKRTKPFLDNIEKLLKRWQKPRSAAADRQLFEDFVDNLLDLTAIIRTQLYMQNPKLRESATRDGRKIPRFPFGRKGRHR
jgi:hypothetical protein